MRASMWGRPWAIGRRAHAAALVVLGAVLAVGCDGGIDAGCPEGAACYLYEGLDDGGVPVVRGTVVVQVAPTADADGVRAVSGTWRFDRLTSTDVGPQVGAGLLAGAARGDRLAVLLTPDAPSRSVELAGVVRGDRWEGLWTWAPDDAPPRSGTFEAVRD